MLDLLVRRRVVLVAGVVLLAALVTAALHLGGEDEPAAGVTVGWDDSQGHPGCVYDPERRTVDATLAIDGEATGPVVAVTVTAYADENTSRPVGSSSRSVAVEGTVHRSVVLAIAVEKAPFVDIDGVAACSLSVED